MAEGGYRERFIEVERQASTLLDELGAVQTAASQYTAAGESLESASADLRQIAERSENLIQEVGHLASTLDKVGGGELLHRQAAIEERAAGMERAMVSLQEERIPSLATAVGRLQTWMIVGFIVVTALAASSLLVGIV